MLNFFSLRISAGSRYDGSIGNGKGARSRMDADMLSRIGIVAGAAGAWALCVKNAVRCLLARRDDPVAVKLALLSAGLFAALVMGAVILADAAGLPPACAWAACLLLAAVLADALAKPRWEAAERERLENLASMRAAVEALRARAEAGQAPTLEESCAKAARRFDLTRREEEVLGLLVEGLSYADIEERLHLSHSTVKSHVRNLYRKLGVNRREQLLIKLDTAS